VVYDVVDGDVCFGTDGAEDGDNANIFVVIVREELVEPNGCKVWGEEELTTVCVYVCVYMT